jgi:predicted  nucleic acid-binding Zn-ribbon protein
MSAPGPVLQEIHRLRRHVKDLAGKIEQGPRLLKAQQTALARQEEALKQGHDAVKHLKVEIHQKEVSVKSAEEHIAKLEKTQISNKKEYDALRVEIAGVQKTIRGLEDEILELMSQVEDKNKLLPDLEKAVAKAKADAEQLQKDHQEKMDRFTAERQKALADLQQVETNLPEETRIQYQRLINAKGEDGLAAVEGTTCTACYTEVTSQMINELSRGVFVICKNCGRMLYGAKAE